MDPVQAAQQAAQQGNMSSQAAREVSVMLSANAGPYKSEMGQAAGATDKVADALEALDKAYKAAITRAGEFMIATGVASQGAATGAIAMAASFEESFARVAKTTSLRNEFLGQTGRVPDLAAAFGLGDNALQQLENDIRGLSTQIPVAVGELSHLADVAGTLGVESENLELFADTAAKLGAGINELGSDVAIAGLANLIEGFGRAETEVVNLGSSLAELSNHTRGNAADMLEFSNRLQGTAVQVGITAEEVLGLGAAVSAIGAQPRLGASAIIQTVTEINKALQSGGDQARRFAQTMGMTVDELQAMWSEQGPTKVLVELLRAISTQGDQATTTLSTLGLSGVGTTQVLGGMAAQLSVVEDALAKSSAASREGAAVNELAAVRFDTLTKSMQRFRQSTGEVFRSMGEGFLPILKTLVDAGTAVVNIFNALPQPIKTSAGLLLGFGGAALTAAGAFTIFFGKFHLFFIALEFIPKLLTKAAHGIASLGTASAGAASANLLRLADTFTRLQGAIGAVLASFTAAGKAIGTAWAASVAVAAKSLRELRAGLLLAGRGLAVFSRMLVVETFHSWVFALKASGQAVGFLVKQLGMATLAMAKFLAPYAIVAGIIAGAVAAFKRMRRGLEDLEGTLKDTAEAAELTFSALEDVAELDLGEAGPVDIAIGAKELLADLDKLDQATRRDYLADYGMVLVAQGNDPTEVKEFIEELGRMSQAPIVFNWTLEELHTGEGFRAGLESAMGTMERFAQVAPEETIGQAIQGFGGMFGFKPEGLIRWNEQLEDHLATLKQFGAANAPARLAAYTASVSELEMSMHRGDITLNQFNDAIKQINELELLPVDDPGFFDQVTGWRDALESFFTSPEFANVEGFEDLRSIVEDVTGQTEDLGNALGRLTGEQVAEITERWADLAEEMVNVTEMERVMGFDTELRRQMEAALSSLGEDEFGRFWDNFMGTFPQQVGFAEAIRQGSHELDLLVEDGKAWGEEADRIRTALEGWTEEFAQMQVDDLSAQLNGLEAADQIDLLLSKLRSLTGQPWETEVRVKTVELLQQTFGQQEQAFRSAMGQYDNLIDQREDAVEAHNRRMGDMEEDRARSVKEAHESHAKAMEDANKNHKKQLEELNQAEEEALEERVDQQTQAFDILERIQARPSADIGAMLHNIEAQNRAMEEMVDTVGQLEDMGLSSDVIEQLGFDDPTNFAQARRLLESSLSDPGMIDEINAAWQDRLQISKAFVDESDTDEIKKDFAKRRKELEESFAEQKRGLEEGLDEQLSSIAERHSRAVEDANKNHQRQLDNITEQLAELGDRSFETLDELIEKASESGLDKLKEWGEEIKGLREEIELVLAGPIEARGVSQGRPVAGHDASQMEEMAPGTANWARYADDALGVFSDAFRAQVQPTWRSITGEMDFESKKTISEIADEFDTGSQEILEIFLKGLLDPAKWSRMSGELKTALNQAFADMDLTGLAESMQLGDAFTEQIASELEDAFRDASTDLSERSTEFRTYGMNEGGVVPGSGNEDEVPALLTPGEYVIPKEAVSHYGVSMFNAIRAQRYATGGLVTRRGSEPVGQDAVSALEKALEKASMGSSEQTNYGPITVQAQDVNDMMRQLEARRRRSRLTNRGGNVDV